MGNGNAQRFTGREEFAAKCAENAERGEIVSRMSKACWYGSETYKDAMSGRIASAQG